MREQIPKRVYGEKVRSVANDYVTDMDTEEEKKERQGKREVLNGAVQSAKMDGAESEIGTGLIHSSSDVMCKIKMPSTNAEE